MDLVLNNLRMLIYYKTQTINQPTNQILSLGVGGVWIVMIIFTNPSARAGYDIRSIFKRSLTGLNSEFSFS